jgi:hypothetical protein
MYLPLHALKGLCLDVCTLRSIAGQSDTALQLMSVRARWLISVLRSVAVVDVGAALTCQGCTALLPRTHSQAST